MKLATKKGNSFIQNDAIELLYELDVHDTDAADDAEAWLSLQVVNSVEC